MADVKDAETSISEAPAHLEPLLEGFRRLYVSKDYSDLTITSTALGGVFKEAKESKISLDDDEPQVVEAFVYYLYNFGYGEFTNRSTDVPPIVLDVKMYTIADKTFVEPLKALAAHKFAERAKTEWNTPAFADAVTEVYECTTAGDVLRRTIISAVIKHKGELLGEKGETMAFRKVLRETVLGAEVALGLYSKNYKCPHCSKIFYAMVDEGIVFACPAGCSRKSVNDWAEYALAV